MTADRIRKALGSRSRRIFRLFEVRNPYLKISPEIWKDKIVFDIAPDVGLTPSYLLKMGAKKVVVYTERKGQIDDKRVEWNGKFYIYDILLKYSDDDINSSVLVMDCDGYEHVIKPDKLVSLFPSWVVAIHTANLEYDSWFDILNKNGDVISNKRKVKQFTNLPLKR
jgi:hypothetical protein